MPDYTGPDPRDSMKLERVIHELQTTVQLNISSQRELSQTMKDLRSEIATTYVRKDVLDPTLEAIKQDVRAHGEWITWAMRIVLALVITAVVGAVLVTGR